MTDDTSLQTLELSAWCRSRGVDKADEAQLLAVFEARDAALARVSAAEKDAAAQWKLKALAYERRDAAWNEALDAAAAHLEDRKRTAVHSSMTSSPPQTGCYADAAREVRGLKRKATP